MLRRLICLIIGLLAGFICTSPQPAAMLPPIPTIAPNTGADQAVLLSAMPTTAPPEGARLRSFYYQYSGMMMPPFSGIDAEMTQDGWTATFLLGPQGDAEDVPLTEQDVEALERLVEACGLRSWAGFDEIDPSILDGEGFTFSAAFADGTRIDAHGSNSFPKGYFDAQAAILSSIEEMLIAHGIEYTYD